MKAVFDERQRAHDPESYLVAGVFQPNPERPERIDALMAGAEAAGLSFVAPVDHGRAPVVAVHSPEYLQFLQTIHARWRRMPGASRDVIPGGHPRGRECGYPASAVGQAGWHMADASCPIAADTWESAWWSAQTAVSAADRVAGGARAAYALCRPPGHHACADMAGGFCFLANTAIAAQRLVAAGHRPAILDVDVHHGNGTQGIFYRRADVLTVSIHADPARYYPFFWGHAHERGAGAGEGFNLNLPLPRGSDDDAVLAGLEPGLERIRAFAPDVLVVALGLDAFAGDPLQGFSVTAEGFSRLGAAIAALRLPTLLVQEGGYPCPELGDNLAAFLRAFREGSGA